MADIFVLSESGDILSPKYAPATIAPATAGSGAPIPAATLIRAAPTVPAAPQEVPVLTERITVTRKEVMIIYFGLII